MGGIYNIPMFELGSVVENRCQSQAKRST